MKRWKITRAQFEWKIEDLWIGVFWKHGYAGNRRRWTDVWLCLLPCLPLHVTIFYEQHTQPADDPSGLGWRNLMTGQVTQDSRMLQNGEDWVAIHDSETLTIFRRHTEPPHSNLHTGYLYYISSYGNYKFLPKYLCRFVSGNCN